MSVPSVILKSGRLWANRFFPFLVILPFLLIVGCASPIEQANAYYEKGMALLKKGDLEKAQLEFRNALQIKKNLTTAMYGLALIAEKKGDWKQMFGLLISVVEQDPNHLEAQVKLGRLLLAAGQLDKALDASNKALALNKDDPSVITLHAGVLLKMGDAKGAI